MTNDELSKLIEDALAHRITAKAAIAKLVADGYEEADAEELVFFAFGGSDLVETGPDGVDRYPGGRTVAEVEADMEREA